MDDLGYLKENIKNWIKMTRGMDRAKLASLCGVSKRTIDNWLTAKGNIPEAQRIILELAVSGKNKRKKNEFYKINLNFSFEEFQQMKELAAKDQVSVKRWITLHIKKHFETSTPTH